MIIGSHVIVFSSDPEADRAFFADVLGHPHVDAGGGWLIFKLPPAELAVHPSDGPGLATALAAYRICRIQSVAGEVLVSVFAHA